MKGVVKFFCVVSLLGACTLVSARPSKIRSKVVFATSMDCPKCAEKVRNTVAFEKGVLDLEADAALKTVTIVFDPAKTDTLKLGNAIRRIGYKARAVDLSSVK